MTITVLAIVDVDLITAMKYVKKVFASRLLLGVCLIMGLYFVCISALNDRGAHSAVYSRIFAILLLQEGLTLS